jgi:competence protein ComEC
MAAPDEPPRRPAAGLAGGISSGISSTWPARGAAQAGPLAGAGSPTWTRFIERLRAWARAEAGAGRLLP